MDAVGVIGDDRASVAVAVDPVAAKVAGMNCMRPRAPALEVALLRLWLVSSIPTPASSVQGSLYRFAAAS